MTARTIIVDVLCTLGTRAKPLPDGGAVLCEEDFRHLLGIANDWLQDRGNDPVLNQPECEQCGGPTLGQRYCGTCEEES